MKIAIYGGAFNPVHNEHVNIVKAAMHSLCLDKLIVVPSAISPHKRTTMTASPRARLKMCCFAFSEIAGVEVSDYEIKKGGISYSYLTCRHFKKLYKDDELYFIVGADMLSNFHMWKEPLDILKNVTLAVCARENAAELQCFIKQFSSKFKHSVVNFGYVGKDVSSTKVRVYAALGEEIKHLVPEKVAKFIKKDDVYSLKELWGVKKLLTFDRWEHTVRVAVYAAENCRGVGLYEIDAITAAALHDCAKYMSENAAELEGFTFPKGYPQPVLHQFSGAYVAEHTFGVKDELILNAIRYHTTGRENMGKLEKLIFLSDLLEYGRDFDGVDKLRKKMSCGLDACLKASLEHQLEYLKSTGAPVCKLTQRAYDYLNEI